jgi:hypothetical protein
VARCSTGASDWRMSEARGERWLGYAGSTCWGCRCRSSLRRASVVASAHPDHTPAQLREALVLELGLSPLLAGACVDLRKELAPELLPLPGRLVLVRVETVR